MMNVCWATFSTSTSVARRCTVDAGFASRSTLHVGKNVINCSRQRPNLNGLYAIKRRKEIDSFAFRCSVRTCFPTVPGDAEPTKSCGWTRVMPLSRTFTKIWPFLLPQMLLILKAWVCAMIAVVSLFLFVPEVGTLSALLGEGNLSMLGKKSARAMLFVAMRSTALYWQQSLLWEVSLRMTYEVRAHVFNLVLMRDMSYFEGDASIAKGDIAYRISAEAEDIGDTIYSFLHMIVPCALQLTAMAGRMISLNPILSIAVISVVPCMSVVIATLGEQLRELSKQAQDSIAGIAAYLNEVLPSMFIVKACGAEAYESRKFNMLAEADLYAHLSRRKMKALIPEAITAVYAATGAVLFGIGAWTISHGNFDGAGMISFVTSLVLLIEPVQAIGKAYNEMKQGEPAIERLFALTSFCPKVLKSDPGIHLDNVVGQVEFNNVMFKYGSPSPWVLSGLTFRINSGETVAVVGHSGGGKSTIAKLLLRLYDPVYGKIYIDGIDIHKISLRSLRQKVAIVPQETILFTGTVVENIAYGVMPDKIDMKAVQEAAVMANADEFIEKLPNGYFSSVGERAFSLSGGQRQRLAIARAIYQKPSILVLDEATSALDNASERLVQEALERLMMGRTVLIIAHRLETVKKADRILVLEKGKILQEGTHLSLLSQGGKYADLYTRQDVIDLK